MFEKRAFAREATFISLAFDLRESGKPNMLLKIVKSLFWGAAFTVSVFAAYAAYLSMEINELAPLGGFGSGGGTFP
jgi:hypothetical protein